MSQIGRNITFDVLSNVSAPCSDTKTVSAAEQHEKMQITAQEGHPEEVCRVYPVCLCVYPTFKYCYPLLNTDFCNPKCSFKRSRNWRNWVSTKVGRLHGSMQGCTFSSGS